MPEAGQCEIGAQIIKRNKQAGVGVVDPHAVDFDAQGERIESDAAKLQIAPRLLFEQARRETIQRR